MATAPLYSAAGESIGDATLGDDVFGQPLRIDLQGVSRVDSKASGEMITGELGAINTVAAPRKVVPTAVAISNAAPMFVYDMPPHSVSVIRLKTR